jgi:O-succinylbenzoic acid--CoA ligase
MLDWVQSAALRRPDRTAVETPERSLTYAQLAAEAARMAARLPSGGPVAVALAPGVEFAVALHACLLAGRAFQPVDLRLAESEQRARRRGATTLLDAAGIAPLARGAVEETGLVDRFAQPRLDATMAVMHTSGTTSQPKQVRLTHGNFLASALASPVLLGLDADERWLCPMPLTHVGGLSILVRSAIYATTAVIHPRFDTDAVLDALMDPRRRITLVSLVPTMLQRLLDGGLSGPPTLRWALLGGGPVPPALLARAQAAGVPVAPTYGMTEACSQIATFGYPLPGVEVRVGEDQEILVHGPVVAPGSTDADGWLHTGDLGCLDGRGRLQIVGRKADTIVTGGENVAPTEVEAVLAAHPAVADAGVFARPDEEWGEVVIARVVLHDGARLDADELRAFCRERLAGFKVPKAVEFAAALPRTASGKLLRRQLAGDVPSAQ